jgi:hypothetical protein
MTNLKAPTARFERVAIRGIALLVSLALSCTCTAQNRSIRTYPKEIRGYKVERAVVEIKKPETKNEKFDKNRGATDGANQTGTSTAPVGDVDDLIQLGRPELARITPLGITIEVPIVVSPVKQSGHVDFLMFEDMFINGTPVNVDEYHRPFDLPNKQPVTLRDPLRIYIYLPSAMLAALGEWNESKESWPVTGRVYVFGKFKKAMFSFKRVVPVELNLKMRNPLRKN